LQFNTAFADRKLRAAPLRVDNGGIQLTIDNPNLAKCVFLDSGGYLRKTMALAPSNGEVSVNFPSDTAYA
jgi:hypothetical protein